MTVQWKVWGHMAYSTMGYGGDGLLVGGMPPAKHFAKLKHLLVRFPPFTAKKINLMYRLDLNNDNVSHSFIVS